MLSLETKNMLRDAGLVVIIGLLVAILVRQEQLRKEQYTAEYRGGMSGTDMHGRS